MRTLLLLLLSLVYFVSNINAFISPQESTLKTRVGFRQSQWWYTKQSPDDSPFLLPASNLTEVLYGSLNNIIPASWTPNEKKRVLNSLREVSGFTLSVLGVIGSMTESLAANPGIVPRIFCLYQFLFEYLDKTGILDNELKEILNIRLRDNQAILGYVQEKALNGGDRRDALLSSDITLAELNQTFPFHEARRYVKYAVAAYGDTIIKATDIDTYGKADFRVGEWTKQRIAEHIGLPESDLIHTDAEYYGDAEQLRHFVAVDHVNHKVVLAIRGTFTHSEIAFDLSGYSRPFCGGESHMMIATMVERLWEKVGDIVLQALDDNEGYELILTGHSLGGGATLSLNILLHEDQRLKEKAFRAFAFASPPVYTPLSEVPKARKTAVNYIHQMDEVPFLSADSVRHYVAAIAAIDKATQDMSLLSRAKLVLGLDPPPDKLVDEIVNILCSPLPALPGAPDMAIPVATNAWLWGTDDGTYDVKLCDPTLLAKSGIHEHPDKMRDHLPARYEYAFVNLSEEYG